MPALTFIFKRILESIPVLLVIVTLSFFMIKMAPGGPFDGEKQTDPKVLALLNAQYGLDQPLHIQYGRFLGNLLSGDLGPSTNYPGWSVSEIIFSKLPVSIELGFYAFLLALLFGVTLGTISAIRPNSSLDHIPMSLSLLGICMPSFVIGPILLLVFSLKLHWFNVQGWQFTADKVLPTLTLSLFYTAFIARLTRSSLIETLNQDYIRTAIAKGLTPFRVIFVHALRNGISPVISYLGPALAGLISGSFVVETIFQIPGLGRFFVLSAINRDVSLTIGVVLFYAILILLFNLLVDILLVIINPKRSFND